MRVRFPARGKSVCVVLAILAAVVMAMLYWRRTATLGSAEKLTTQTPHTQIRAEKSAPADSTFAAPNVESSSTTAPVIDDRTRAARLVEQIRKILASSDLSELETVFTKLLPALVRLDPPAAARLAESITDPDLRDEIMRRVAQLWADKDYFSAFSWARGLTNETERDAALAAVSTQIARADPAKAVQMQAEALKAGQTNSTLENLAQHWAESDFTSALSWTLTHTEGAQRDGLLGRLAFIRARTAPVEAATLVTANMTAGYAQNEAILSVLHEWAQYDLKGAAAWLGQFPDDGLRERGLRELSNVAQYRNGAKAP